MSLINDALKQARKAPPRNPPSALPPLQPAADEASPVAAWLLPADRDHPDCRRDFFHRLGRGAPHRPHHRRRARFNRRDADRSPQIATARRRPARRSPPPPPLNPPDAPKLQGIFYSPTAPSAIVDGKTVRPGDQFGQYRVKAISKFTVTLIGPDKKEIQIGMGN